MGNENLSRGHSTAQIVGEFAKKINAKVRVRVRVRVRASLRIWQEIRQEDKYQGVVITHVRNREF